MGLQPGVKGGGWASITALGDVMSRWPGATEEPVPSRNNPQHSSTAAPPQPSTGPDLVVTQGWSSREERKRSGGLGDVSLTRFNPLSCAMERLLKWGVSVKIISLTTSSSLFRPKLYMRNLQCQQHAQRCFWISNLSTSWCEARQSYINIGHHLKQSSCSSFRLELPEAQVERKKNLFSIPSYSRAWQV